MPDFDQIREIKQRAQSRLLAIPGVHAVGIGLKIVNGKRTNEPAIMVFVVSKKPPSELNPNELIPPEIEGVKTDVFESAVPTTRAGDDDSKARPLIGGVQIQPGGGAAGENDDIGGTVGCIAHTDEPEPRIVALTCHHVVANRPDATPSKLKVQPAFPVITFSGENTPGSLIRVLLPGVDVYVVTGKADTLPDIATAVAARITAQGAPGIAAVAAGPQVTVNGANNALFNCQVFDVAKPDGSAKVHASIEGTTISLSGQASGAYIAYLSWNTGNAQRTFSAFVLIQKGEVPSDVARHIAQAINNRAIPSVNAAAVDTQVTVNGVQQVDCYINSDTRVGQPTDTFCSKCSKCCDKRIGVVLDSRIDIDAAVIQLDPGLEYRAEIKEINGAISGSRPLTMADIGNPIIKRGRKTGLTTGTILALSQDGYMTDPDPRHNPPEWVLFARHYQNAISIRSGNVPFSRGGDSGSAVVVTSGTPQQPVNEVVGIMFGGDDIVTLATPIEQITNGFEFELIVEVADKAGVTKTVPKPVHAMSALGLEPAMPAFAPVLMKRLQEMHREVTSTPVGVELVAAFERHADEVQKLVNTNPRVATIWQRNGGPAILQGLLEMLQSPDRRLPEEIEGKPLRERLLRIQKAFARYASAAFAADLVRFGPELIEMSGLSYVEALAGLRAASPR